ncbi:MAG: DUF5680 domain-containing protein [Kiloniellales bacterium]|nr:DUF5680 domain-containing protein [Kiloniellales bacterium]
MELVDFLTQARRETYAIPHGESLGDGTEHMAWDRGEWSYRDRYAGTNPYGGQELVRREGKVVWMMNYYAEVLTARPSMDEIYAFQREVLGQPDPARPMRGPARYASGPFTYRNEVRGDLDRFSGQETIRHEEAEVYRMVFHGGLVGS